MECIHLTFDYQKATQAINFFAQKNGGSINKLRVIKLLFFADRYHLRKYARLVTNDDYIAMKLGPVSSGTKDIIDSNSAFIDPDIIDYSTKYLQKKENDIASINDIDFDVFSKSDIEALTFAWNEFSTYSPYALKDLTHKYPEWKKHKAAIDSGTKRITMNFKDFFDDPESKYNPCHTLSEDEKQYNLQTLVERSQAKNDWD